MSCHILISQVDNLWVITEGNGFARIPECILTDIVEVQPAFLAVSFGIRREWIGRDKQMFIYHAHATAFAIHHQEKHVANGWFHKRGFLLREVDGDVSADRIFGTSISGT